MEYQHDHDCGKIGRQTGLLCAALGLVIAAIMFAFGLWWASAWMIAAISFGSLALFVTSGFFGTKAGIFLCWNGNKLPLNIIIGLSLAFGSITIALIAGNVFLFFFHDSNQIIKLSDFWESLIVSLLLVFIFGGIPAAVLGVVYGLVVRMRLKKR